MFLTHFKFTSQPFAERVPAESLWQDDRMRQGLSRLRYLAEHATVGLVTGASGVGKNALLKRFLHELSGPQWQPVYLHLRPSTCERTTCHSSSRPKPVSVGLRAREIASLPARRV